MFERYVKLDIEQRVLTVLLNKPKKIYEFAIKEEYFLIEENKNIFKAVLRLVQAKKPLTPSMICQEDKSIALEYVLAIYNDTYNFDIGICVDYLKNNALNYNALVAMQSIMNESQERDVDIRQELSNIIYNWQEDGNYKQNDISNDLLNTLDRKIKNGGKLEGVLTGISDFDEIINGFNPGRLYVCGARSSMGKSAFMCSCAEHMIKEGKVGIVSLEMTKLEIAQRIVCIRSDIPYWVIDKGRANQYQFDKFCKEVEKMDKFQNIIIDDRGGLDCAEVCCKIRQMVKSGCKIVFVDHLGLVRVDDKKQNLAYLIGKITSSLKALAKELNIPIVCLAQVNRGVEKVIDNRPRLSDLRDSGRIEEDADSVFFLFRPDYYKADSSSKVETAEIIVAKNRNGECKTIHTLFNNQTMQWVGA